MNDIIISGNVNKIEEILKELKVRYPGWKLIDVIRDLELKQHLNRCNTWDKDE